MTWRKGCLAVRMFSAIKSTDFLIVFLVLVFFFGSLDAASVPDRSDGKDRHIAVTEIRVFACRFSLFLMTAIDSTFP